MSDNPLPPDIWSAIPSANALAGLSFALRHYLPVQFHADMQSFLNLMVESMKAGGELQRSNDQLMAALRIANETNATLLHDLADALAAVKDLYDDVQFETARGDMLQRLLIQFLGPNAARVLDPVEALRREDERPVRPSRVLVTEACGGVRGGWPWARARDDAGGCDGR